jgi:hypothetical protein
MSCCRDSARGTSPSGDGDRSRADPAAGTVTDVWTDSINPPGGLRGGVQVVGYETGPGGDTGHAALVTAADGRLDREPLPPGRTLAYALGARHCAGTVEDGRHVGCQESASPYCDRHTSRWACARCTGECSLPLDACHEDHAVYLAAFAPETFKVGVTRSWRLDTRLREQGADRAAHLRTVPNGRTARRVEADIAAEVGDRVRVPTKVRGLHLPVDEAAWEALLAGFDPRSTHRFEYGLDLDSRPVAETLASGTVRGTQGRVLVLDYRENTYAVDMRDLVGHELQAGEPDRDLQSSLGAFG